MRRIVGVFDQSNGGASWRTKKDIPCGIRGSENCRGGVVRVWVKELRSTARPRRDAWSSRILRVGGDNGELLRSRRGV